MDDWQDTAFTTRHVHNRVGKSSRGQHGGSFEVKKAFGRYDVKCASATRMCAGSSDSKSTGPIIDVFRLSDDGRGVLGELLLPGVLEARIVLAGSRKALEELVSQLEKDTTMGEGYEGDLKAAFQRLGSSAASEGEESQATADNEADSDEEAESRQRRRFQNFEKNSFRSPKFWFQWRGTVMVTPAAAVGGPGETCPKGCVETGRGYVVFSGNDCRSFKGTISCDILGWKDVSISGRKAVPMSERDAVFVWDEENRVPR
ncbi:hypothetical protein CCHL11_07051 [Colletotrichum chlorophyti]|uniref:Uncharacterized protein n=1 Tax=Colletotrichum chlorophyti TaxID=708187 RepID=A0A1Q8RC00_9PEZI|nr:hypothetical protein CCHL11_07051 [Colletotrichum chlorophyti]